MSLKLALVTFSTVLALAAAEAALRVMGWEPLRINEEQLHFWTHDPLLGWAHRPGQEGEFEKAPLFTTHVRINQKGLRDGDHGYERTGDRKRILLLGDSFAWGFGVEHGERLSERLEAALGVDVINAGISGYSTDQMLLWLRDEGTRYDFDLVLLVFSAADVYDNRLSRNYFIYNKPWFELAGDSLVLKGVPVPEPDLRLRLERFLRRHSAFAQGLYREVPVLREKVTRRLAGRRSDGGQRDPSMASSAVPFALTRALVDEMRVIAHAREAGFLVVSTPFYWVDLSPEHGGVPGGTTYPELIESLRSDGSIVLDVQFLPGWDASRMVIPRDGHWSSEGHEFVAGAVQRLIEERRLLDRDRAEAHARPDS